MTGLPFKIEWQRSLVALCFEDDRFAELVAPHVEAKYFESEVLQWVWATREHHRQKHGSYPTWTPVREYARQLEPRTRQSIEIALEHLSSMPVQDPDWVRATTVEWLRKNVFVRCFHTAKEQYNAGRLDEAYDTLMTEMDRFQAISLAPEQRGVWLFEELPERQAKRIAKQSTSTATGTGIPQLDRAMGGGLDLGQFGLFMAFSKIGKTSLLVNLGRVATQAYLRNVAHFFFEGTKDQIENRYDASFSKELYAAVRRGEFGEQRYAHLFAEYQQLRRKLYLRGFVDRWSYTVEDVWEELARLKRREGWVPHVLLIDYADLLHGRGNYGNDLDSNAAAYRDLKTLSTKGQGYALWSAAQAKKPSSSDFDLKPSTLHSPDLGGRYEKVKVCDFLASMNATLEERRRGIMRVFVELARDSTGGVEVQVPIDFDRMVFGAGAGTIALGYGNAPPAVPPQPQYVQTRWAT